MKCFRAIGFAVWTTAGMILPATADDGERPGEVAALTELKPYLLLLDEAELGIDGSIDAWGSTEEMARFQALLSKAGTFLPWKPKKDRADFKADHTIAWSVEQRAVELSLSLTSNEALLDVGKDERKLRYEIDEDAKWELVKLFRDREDAIRAMIEAHKEQARAKADPVEKTDSWRQSIAEGATLTVHEGLPHPGELSYKREIQRKDARFSAGHAFYTPGVVARNRPELAKIIADAGSYHRLSGAKECGGFHPDFAVSWLSDRRVVMLLVCYGCHEVIFTDGNTSWRYDLDHKAGDRMKPLLRANGGKRPATVPASDSKPHPSD